MTAGGLMPSDGVVVVWGCAHWPQRMPDDDQLHRTSDATEWFVGFWADGELAHTVWVLSEEEAEQVAKNEALDSVPIRRDELAVHVLEAWHVTRNALASMRRDQEWFAEYQAGRDPGPLPSDS